MILYTPMNMKHHVINTDTVVNNTDTVVNFNLIV